MMGVSWHSRLMAVIRQQYPRATGVVCVALLDTGELPAVFCPVCGARHAVRRLEGMGCMALTCASCAKRLPAGTPVHVVGLVGFDVPGESNSPQRAQRDTEKG